eukprot:Awhi_evm3s10906
MGWSRVGGVYTTDSFALNQFKAVRTAASSSGVNIEHEISLPKEMSDREEVRSKLQELKDQKLKVFFIAAVTTPLHIIFEEAHKLGIFGVDGYLWITTQGIAFNNFFSTWDYGLEHPEITTGIMRIN